MLSSSAWSALLRQRNRIIRSFARNHLRLLTTGGGREKLDQAVVATAFHIKSNPIFRKKVFETAKRWLHTTRQLNQFEKQQPRPDGGGGPEDEYKRMLRFFYFTAAVFLVMLLLRYRSNESNNVFQSQVVSWTEFVHEMLAKGEVEEIIIRPQMELALIRLYPNAIYRGRPVTSMLPFFQMRIANVHVFEEQLRKAEMQMGISADKGVSVVYERQYSGEWIMLAVLILASFLIYRRLTRNQLSQAGAKGGRGGFDIFGGIRKARFRLVDPLLRTGTPRVTFADVAGLHEAKIEVKEFVDYLKRPETYTRLGAKLPKGALLLGPPGCGKTLLAKAVATEANVPFLAMNGTEFVEMIGGLGAARVRDLFSEAKRRAPCIIYIDEIDAIGKKRSGDSGGGTGGFAGSGEEEQTLNQLLVEMDGMDSAQGLIILGSTNRPDILDKALLRRGRFDRHISIDMPTLIERRELFEYYLKKIKLDDSVDKYAPRMAQLTPGFSGADINNVCNEAALHAATGGQKTVTSVDLHHALDRVLSGPEKKSSPLVPEEKEVIAYHEAGKALVGWMLEHTDLLLKVSIVPRTVSSLGFAQYNPQDRKLYSKEDLMDRMCMALGGRAAENMKFGRVTTKGEDDLRKITRIAYDQVRVYGMNENVGPISFAAPPGQEREAQFYKKPYSKKMQSLIDHEATQLVGAVYRRTESVLRKNVDKLEKVAQALLKKEVLTYEQMKELIGPPPYPHKTMVENVDLTLPSPHEVPGVDDSPPPPPPKRTTDDI